MEKAYEQIFRTNTLSIRNSLPCFYPTYLLSSLSTSYHLKKIEAKKYIHQLEKETDLFRSNNSLETDENTALKKFSNTLR